MARGYRILQHWDQWLTHQHLGSSLLAAEQQILSDLLNRHLGKHALLIGVPQQSQLLNATRIPCHTLLTPLSEKKFSINYIEGDLHELPIQTGNIDLVILPHTLEFVDNPRQLLAEACRIIKPEGLIAITGFNPYSLWGIKKIISKNKTAPWSGNFLHANIVKNWLQLADFCMEKRSPVLFRPPLKQATMYQKLNFVERIGSQCFPFFGGAYVLIARAKVIPLTPIRLKWKQQLSGIRISTSVSGHAAR